MTAPARDCQIDPLIQEMLLARLLMARQVRIATRADAYEAVYHKPVLLCALDVAPPVSEVRFIYQKLVEELPYEYEYPLVMCGRAPAAGRWVDLPIELPDY